MKHPVYRLIPLLLVLASGLGVASLHAAEGGEVQSPTKRQESLDKAKKLLASRDIAAPAVDPFHSASFSEMVATLDHAPSAAAAGGENESAKSSGPRTGRDQLKAIAEGLKPSGYYVFSGQPTLLFGQKRVKAGGFVTITFEGTEYTVEITSIHSPNFTLRLNREEFTRPIK